MRYNVGRACVAGSYTELFNGLGLPEVSIAGEARDSQESVRVIFDAIMASPVKYYVMDDYELIVELRNPILLTYPSLVLDLKPHDVENSY